MKSTGIVRKIDELGRITLPIELRRTLNIGEGEPLEIYVEGDMVVIKKHEPNSKCKHCDATINLHVFKDGHVCGDCINEIQRI